MTIDKLIWSLARLVQAGGGKLKSRWADADQIETEEGEEDDYGNMDFDDEGDNEFDGSL